MTMPKLRILIGLSAMALLAACGQNKGQPAGDASSGARAPADAPASPGGAIDTAKLPDGRPAFASDYPGATNTSYMPGATDGNMKSGMLQFESTDSADAIISYYRAKANAAGFANSPGSGNLGDMSVYNATGASNAQFGLVVSGKGSPRKVMVTWVAPA